MNQIPPSKRLDAATRNIEMYHRHRKQIEKRKGLPSYKLLRRYVSAAEAQLEEVPDPQVPSELEEKVEDARRWLEEREGTETKRPRG